MGLDDAMFVSFADISENYKCSICTSVLDNPVFASGQPCYCTFCRTCIASWLARNSSCPIDRKPLEMGRLVPAGQMQSFVNELKVVCKRRGNGCCWIGRLDGLAGHEEGCPARRAEEAEGAAASWQKSSEASVLAWRGANHAAATLRATAAAALEESVAALEESEAANQLLRDEAVALRDDAVGLRAMVASRAAALEESNAANQVLRDEAVALRDEAADLRNRAASHDADKAQLRELQVWISAAPPSALGLLNVCDDETERGTASDSRARGGCLDGWMRPIAPFRIGRQQDETNEQDEDPKFKQQRRQFAKALLASSDADESDAEADRKRRRWLHAEAEVELD